MNIKRRIFNRASTAVVFVLGATLSLAGCSSSASSASATPDEVFKNYVSALNSGNVKEALELVANDGEITADNAQRFDDFGTIPEPKLTSNLELDDNVESTRATFEQGLPEQTSVEFVKDNGFWRITEPLFFVESGEARTKQYAVESHESGPERSASTWQEVVDKLDITVKLASGSEFNFPRYIAGVAPRGNEHIPLSLSPLPDWEYLQETELTDAKISIQGNTYTFANVKIVSDPLREDLNKAAAKIIATELTGRKKTDSEGGNFVQNGTQHTFEIIGVEGDCSSGLESDIDAPDVESDDLIIELDCNVAYTDSRSPGETFLYGERYPLDRAGKLDMEYFADYTLDMT